jgi:serine/threonine protein kinase
MPLTWIPEVEIVTLAPGTRLGPYEILSPLGAGGMGEVFSARDTRLERDVAVKVIHQRLAADPNRLARFEIEARARAALPSYLEEPLQALERQLKETETKR